MLVAVASDIVNLNSWGGGVDVGNRGGGGKVDVAGAGVDDCGG